MKRSRAVDHVCEELGVSQRRACQVLGQPRSTQRHVRKVPEDEEPLVERVAELAGQYGRYGYRRITAMLRNEDWRVNYKRVYRLYCEEGLGMRQKPPRRRKACMKREARPLATEKNECWSMDFMSDQLFDGRRIRLLTIVDNHTRESLAIHVGPRIRGCEVVQVLERIVKEHRKPRAIRVDNGPCYFQH